MARSLKGVRKDTRALLSAAAAAGLVLCASLAGAPAKGGQPDEASKREMVISGRVVGVDGKPVSNGHVAVLVYAYRRSEKPDMVHDSWPGLMWAPRLLGSGTTGADGRFRLSGPGYSPGSPYTGATLVAGAPGQGLVWRPIDHAAARQELTVELNPERVVRGRLIDLQGQPAAGARVRLLWTGNLFGHASDLVPFWPKPVTADDKGRFLFRGLGLESPAVEVSHERFAPAQFDVKTVPAGDKTETTLSLVGARHLKGHVTFGDTGKPVAGARLSVTGTTEQGNPLSSSVLARTDGEGRFSLNVFAQDFSRIVVQPPEDSPYLAVRRLVPWVVAAKEELALTLPRGIMVRGRVTEDPAGRPVAAARVQYRARQSNNAFNREPYNEHRSLEEHLATAISGTDGHFQLVVPPGRGHLLVLGPTLDYLHAETTFGELEYQKRGGIRYYPDGLAPVDLKPDAESHEVSVRLRRGVTRSGRVLCPDGKPVERFIVACRSYVPTGYQWYNRHANWLEGRDGHFELPGCDPDRPVTVVIFDKANDCGAVAQLPGKSGGSAPVTIRLGRCGSAEARLVGADGKPVANATVSPVVLVVTPGIRGSGPILTLGDEYATPPEADELWWSELSAKPSDPLNPRTDDRGRVAFRALVPGACYRLVLPNPPKSDRDGWPTKDFAVRAGEMLDLGDLELNANP